MSPETNWSLERNSRLLMVRNASSGSDSSLIQNVVRYNLNYNVSVAIRSRFSSLATAQLRISELKVEVLYVVYLIIFRYDRETMRASYLFVIACKRRGKTLCERRS